MIELLEELEEGGRVLLLTAEQQDAGKRLDVFLAENLPETTRSAAANLMKQGCVLLRGKAASKAGEKLKEGDQAEVTLNPPKCTQLQPENIPLDILYQDADLAVINKPQGMVVHPAPGNESGTLVNALMYHIRDLAGISGELRPGIVHRIDKDTSGLLVIAKNDKAHRELSGQIKEKTAGRIYLAIIQGNLKEEQGTVDAPIGRSHKDRKKMAIVPEGRPARTHYRVLERYEGYSLIECRLETGRTHQIRVHMAYLGHPVAGDPLYAHSDPLKLGAQALHAYELHLVHPTSGENLSFQAPLPECFLRCLRALRHKSGYSQQGNGIDSEKE